MTWGLEFLEAEFDELPDDWFEDYDDYHPGLDREAQLRGWLIENEARWKLLQAEEVERRAEAERRAAEDREQFFAERRRQQRARRANVPHEPYTRQQVFDRDAGRCYMCDRRLNPRDWHVEHVVPIARGGPDTLENVRASCPRCNRRKGTQEPCFRTTF